MNIQIRKTSVFKVISSILILLYVIIAPISDSFNKLNAVLTVMFSILFLWRSRKNLLVCLISFFIFYCNYSIVMGEYLIGGNLGVPIYQVKTVDNYGLLIKTLLLFVGLVTIFYNSKIIDLSKFKLKPKDNIVIFGALILALIYVLLFGVNRAELSSYSVRISPLYEYSTLLFLFAYYYSGKSLVKRNILVGLLIAFVLQDFYYGGRVTSLQLIFLFLSSIALRKLSFKSILINGFIGIMLNSLVGAYRSSYSLHSINLIVIFTNLLKSYFVFSTPVYAYYASATHVAASNIADFHLKMSSFLAFIASIFTGSKDDFSNLTTYISKNYFINMGGGVITSHFYFWLGWSGVILIAIILVALINKLGLAKSDYLKLCSLMIITTTPRWYLYSPLSLFRPLLFLTVLYLLFHTAHNVLLKVSNRNKRTKKVTHDLQRKIAV